MSNRCSRCQASIPSGRNYCTAHYMEVLANYENALATYHQNMAIWNSMSPAEQAAAHVNAEDSSISSYSGLVGFIIGAMAWYILAQSQKIDALLGFGILAVSLVVFTAIKPIRILAGRLARLSIHAVGYFIGLWIIGAIISIWSPFLKDNSSILTSVLAIGVIILSVYLEASGGHHASGRPTMPSKPSP